MELPSPAWGLPLKQGGFPRSSFPRERARLRETALVGRTKGQGEAGAETQNLRSCLQFVAGAAPHSAVREAEAHSTLRSSCLPAGLPSPPSHSPIRFLFLSLISFKNSHGIKDIMEICGVPLQ